MRKFLLAAAGALLLASTAAPSIAQTTTTTTTTVETTYSGKPIYNSSGQVVGTISDFRDNNYYVKADQFLGVGEKVYVFPKDRVVISGSGETVRLTTPLTREQIIVLPSP
jgi:hypothetical protein